MPTPIATMMPQVMNKNSILWQKAVKKAPAAMITPPAVKTLRGPYLSVSQPMTMETRPYTMKAREKTADKAALELAHSCIQDLKNTLNE